MSQSQKYRVILQELWSRPEFQDCGLEKKLLWIYLQTGTNANQLGIYPFLPRYACLETGIPIDQIENIMSEFVDDGLIRYNRKTHEVCVFCFMEEQANNGGKAFTQCVERDMSKVTDKSLIDAMVEYNMPILDKLKPTARAFIESLSHGDNDMDDSNDIEESINKNEAENIEHETVSNKQETVSSKHETVALNTAAVRGIVRDTVRDNNTTTVNDDSVVPTVEQVSKYITDVYFTDTDISDRAARKFVELNEKNDWEYLKSSTWKHLVDKFLSKDKTHVFDSDSVNTRKAEAEKKAEADRIEAERKDEEERRWQEYKSMFRECWNPYTAIHTAQDLINYIKQNHFSEYDYSLGKCLYDKIYVSQTLEPIMVMSLFEKGIICFDEVGDYIVLSDYKIRNAAEPIKRIAEQLSKDTWSEKYRVPEAPKPLVIPKNDTIRQ